MECACYYRNVQDLLADGQTSNERRSKILSEIIKIPRSSASVRHKSPSWKIQRIRLKRGKEVELRICWLRMWKISTQVHHLKFTQKDSALILSSHVGQAKSCKKDSLYPPNTEAERRPQISAHIVRTKRRSLGFRSRC